MRHVTFDTETHAEVVKPEQDTRVARRSRRLPRIFVPGASFAAIWWALNPGDPVSWIVGAPAIAAATAIVLLMPRPPSPPVAIGGALRFASYFAVQTVVGATDVALRAFNPVARPKPGFTTWITHLPEGAPRVAFANAITLLPGTLTASIDADRFTIHLLDAHSDPAPQLAVLEARIAAMFALDPETKE